MELIFNLPFLSIIDWILNGIYKAVWGIFITGPLGLVSVFTKVLEFLSSGIIFSLLFNSQEGFSWSNIPIAFWQFAIVSVAFLVIIFITQYLTLQFKDAKEMQPRLLACFKYTGLAGIFVLFIPIGFFFLNGIITWFMGMLSTIFGTSDQNLADLLYWIGNSNGVAGKPGDYGPPSNIMDWSLIIEIFSICFVLFAIAMLGMSLTQKIFELLFLFIVAPVVMATMVQDEGKRALTWKDMVLSKMLAASTALVAYYIFIIYINVISGPNFGPSDFPGYAKMLLQIICILGGALGVWGITNLLSAFIGEAIGMSDGLNSIRSTMAAGMFAMGAGKVAKKALGFVKKKNKKGSSGIPGIPGIDTFSGGGNQNQSQGISPLSFLETRTGALGMIGKGLRVGGNALGRSIWAVKNGWESTKSAWGDSYDVNPTSTGRLGKVKKNLNQTKNFMKTEARIGANYLGRKSMKIAAKGIKQVKRHSYDHVQRGYKAGKRKER
ncbi:Mbov_0396 family ICE element transmembrane protein [Spiroplasma citri]|uniref:Transmembrane protein n=1 Tax=Spiroplasma citri TaxID=2133 RepID=A0AAJ4EIK8_SPICI|nr:hypothetical protein [Spiroplasma citri]APE74450.1 hypothetical protein SCITRI_00551 [Spiroplasma citri]QED24374.1 hypothetical protein FRX96_02570 [Spiroplasma citri]QIA66638.1 hypothetical protein GMI18_02565 [Spiroplasma citri]QIA68522.1 hypothetical protein GL298_02685 [Spiroplasma citri]QIA70396.1 hypothetical protein GL981_02690 [Spiroplasma citri]